MKKAVVQLTDDERLPVSPDTVGADSEPAEEVDDLEELRKKFVGEVDLPESKLYSILCYHKLIDMLR